MNYKWLLLLLSLVVSGVSAQSYQSSIEIIEQIDDIRLVAFIPESDLENYPHWQPVKEAPPLTISKAIQAVHAYHKKNRTELAAEAVKEIELKKIKRHENYWHYLIKIQIKGGSDAKYQVYIVLMNGKVIPALTEIESYK
jgi:hypothetical protein